MKDRFKLIGVFSVVFGLLAFWTMIVFGDIQVESRVLLAQAKEYEWVEQYRPLYETERDALLQQVKPDELQDGDLLVISYKASILDDDKVVKDTDKYKIWTAGNCYELKRLAMKHKLALSNITISDKTLYVVIDGGIVYSKALAEIQAFAKSAPVKALCSDVLSVRHHSGGHISPGVY